MTGTEPVFKIEGEQILITHFDNGTSVLDTKITDARKVLTILSSCIGGFILTLQQQNPGREDEIYIKTIAEINKCMNQKPKVLPIQKSN